MPSQQVGGKWRFTKYDSLSWLNLGRKVKLPLYKFVNRGNLSPAKILDDQAPDKWGNVYAGRVIVDWCEPDLAGAQLDWFGPNDIVQWPLYYGAPQPAMRGPGLSAPLPTYDANLECLKGLCEKVPNIGILLGNCGSELANHHLICAPDQRQRDWCIDRDVEFIRVQGERAKEYGYRLFVGPMEREVLIDAYHCDWRMARAVQEFDGVMVIFQEGGLFPRWTMIYGNAEADGIWLAGEEYPHPSHPEWRDDYGVFVAWSHREPFPYPTLLAYFEEFSIAHCIGYDREFKLGYDEVLRQHRCRAVVY